MTDPRLKSYYESNNYYLVLELLQSETMERRISRWAKNFGSYKNSHFMNKTACLFC